MTVVADPLVGTRILGDRYEICERIAAGGVAVLYRGHDAEFRRDVAIKILRPGMQARPDVLARFRREARAISHLAHPNTVRVFDWGETAVGCCLVMELLHGVSLHGLLRDVGRLPVDRALRIVAQAAAALDEAHRAGIVHRDLKPENLFVCSRGPAPDFVKVLDFGFARVSSRELGPESVRVTAPGTICGTPQFMSPEQALGRAVTGASDIYSLGVVLYEALTWRLPFHATRPLEYMKMHAHAPPIPLNECVDGVVFSDDVVRIVERALAKRPADRFASAGAFADELVAVADRLAALPPSATPRPAPTLAVLVDGGLPSPASPPLENLRLDARAQASPTVNDVSSARATAALAKDASRRGHAWDGRLVFFSGLVVGALLVVVAALVR